MKRRKANGLLESKIQMASMLKQMAEGSSQSHGEKQKRLPQQKSTNGRKKY